MDQEFSKICNTAILRTGMIDSKSINESYDRLFLTLVEYKKYNEVNTQTVCRDFNDFYATSINEIFTKNFLNRLANQGYAKKIKKYSLLLYRFDYKKIETLKLLDKYNKLLSEYELLLSDLISFLNKKGIRRVDKRKAIEILEKAIENRVSNLGDCTDISGEDNYLFIMSEYVNNLQINNEQLFEIYKNITYGRILSAFIDGNEKYLFANKSFFKDAVLYLDSGFVFDLLGLNSISNAYEYVELIKTLQQLGAHIKIFKHIFEEIETIIYGSIYWVENPSYKPSLSPNVTNYFIQNKFTKIEVEEFYHSLTKKMNQFGISIEEFSIDYNEQDNKYEKEFYDLIIKEYKETGKIDEDKNRTYWNDAKSLYLIHKLRKGKTQTRLSEATHILLTTNSSIGRVANYYNKRNYDGNNIPFALTDLSLNALLYISYGDYSERISERFLIPAAFHGFNPTKEWLVSLDSQLDKAKDKGVMTEEQIISWKTSKFLIDELVKTTQGNPQLFKENTFEETLKRYKKDADEMVERIDIEANQKINQIEKEKTEQKIRSLEKQAYLKDQIIISLNENIAGIAKERSLIQEDTDTQFNTIKMKERLIKGFLIGIVAILTISLFGFFEFIKTYSQLPRFIKLITGGTSTILTSLIATFIFPVILKIKNSKKKFFKICRKHYEKIKTNEEKTIELDQKERSLQEQIDSVKNGGLDL